MFEDYSARVREARRKLVPFMLAKRRDDPDIRCYLRHDKLICGSDTYRYDECLDDIVRCGDARNSQS